MNFWLTYLSGVITLPLLALLLSLALCAFGRSNGSGPCVVCGHGRDMEIGEHRNITVWLALLWHRLLWSFRPWHRRAWADNKWNPRSIEAND